MAIEKVQSLSINFKVEEFGKQEQVQDLKNWSQVVLFEMELKLKKIKIKKLSKERNLIVSVRFLTRK